METHPVKPSFSMRTDGRADRRRDRDVSKIIVAFRNFGKTPKIDDYFGRRYDVDSKIIFE